MRAQDLVKAARYNKTYYDKNRSVFAERKRRYRQEAQALLRTMKDVPCADCGIQYPPYVMDFDHRPGETKLFNVASGPSRASMPAFLREVAKCDVVCANCHRERTHGG